MRQESCHHEECTLSTESLIENGDGEATEETSTSEYQAAFSGTVLSSKLQAENKNACVSMSLHKESKYATIETSSSRVKPSFPVDSKVVYELVDIRATNVS